MKAREYVWVVELLVYDEWLPCHARSTRRAAREEAKREGMARVRKAVFVASGVVPAPLVRVGEEVRDE